MPPRAPKGLNAKLIFVNAPTRNNEKSRAFYSALLGSEFARGLNPTVASWWTPLDDGIDLNVTERYDDRERLTPYFAVDDLAAAIKRLEGLGARLVVPPREVPLGPTKAREFYAEQLKKQGQRATEQELKTAGRMAVLLDPDLNHVGLMEVAPHAQPHFKAGKHRVKVNAETTAAFAAVQKVADQLESSRDLPTP